MTDMAVLESTDYSLSRRAVSAAKRTKGPAALTEPPEKSDTWSLCLLAVRDAQDAAAFARLFHHFGPRIKSFLMAKGASDGMAEEAMQEAMAVVWFKVGMFDPSRASASTWIFTIARNKYLDAVRKTKRPEPEEIEWEGEAPKEPTEMVAAAQEADLIKDAINRLPEAQRLVVEKAYFGDLSHAEIAEVTGLPLGTIKSRIRLGLERMKRDLAVLT